MNIDKQALGKAVVRYMNGDGKAFEEIYNLTNDSAYYTALKIVKNEDDALDIVQESYMTVLKKISTLDKPESFMSWFNMIVANNSRMLLRKNNPMLFEDLSPDSEDGELSFQDMIEDEDTEFIPGADIEQEELRDGIKKLVDGLSPDKRAVVILHYYNNLSVAEIAKALKISENTVKTRLFYSRKDLKAGIEALEKKNAGILGIAPMALVRWALNMDSLGAGSDMPSPAEFISRFQDAAAHGTSVFEKLGGKFSELFGDISQKIHSLFDSGFDPKPVAAVVVTAGIVVGGVVAGTRIADKNDEPVSATQITTEVTAERNTYPGEAEAEPLDPNKKLDSQVYRTEMKYGVNGTFQNYSVNRNGNAEVVSRTPALDRSKYSAGYDDLLPAARENREKYSSDINDILYDVNRIRAASGKQPLVLDTMLTEQANVRAEDIAWSGRDNSIRYDDSTFETFFERNGFVKGAKREIRAYNYSSAENASSVWQKGSNSAVISDSAFERIGIGAAEEPASGMMVYVIHLYSENPLAADNADIVVDRVIDDVDDIANELIEDVDSNTQFKLDILNWLDQYPIFHEILNYDFKTLDFILYIRSGIVEKLIEIYESME